MDDVQFLRYVLLFALLGLLGVWWYVSTFLESSVFTAGMVAVAAANLLLVYRADWLYSRFT